MGLWVVPQKKDPRDPQDGVGLICLKSTSCGKTLKTTGSESWTEILAEKEGSDPQGLACRVGRDPWSGFCSLK